MAEITPEVALERVNQINEAWKAIKEDFGLDQKASETAKHPIARQNPWLKNKAMIPATTQRAMQTVTFRVYNAGPLPQTSIAGVLKPAFDQKKGIRTGRYGVPVEVHEIEVQTHNTGDYKIDLHYTEGSDFVENVVSPSGDPECDLRNWGVFSTTFKEGTPEFEAQYEEAVKLLHKKYSELIMTADALWDTNNYIKRGEITNIYRIACREMGESREWCHVLRPKTSCPACGRGVELGAAKCGQSDCGAILDWNKARKFRIVTKAEYDEAVADGLVASPVADASALKATLKK